MQVDYFFNTQCIWRQGAWRKWVHIKLNCRHRQIWYNINVNFTVTKLTKELNIIRVSFSCRICVQYLEIQSEYDRWCFLHWVLNKCYLVYHICPSAPVLCVALPLPQVTYTLDALPARHATQSTEHLSPVCQFNSLWDNRVLKRNP